MKLRNILIGLFVLVLGVGCKGKDEVSNNGEAISCTPTIKVAKMSGEEFTVKVSSPKPWFAAKDKKWVTVEPSTGLGNTDVTISLEAGQLDTARIAFSNGINDVTLTIYRGSKNDVEASKNFVGTYELHTTMYIHKSKGIDTIAEYISDMTIYEDNGLMVQTELFGMPDTARHIEQQISFNDIYGIRNKVNRRITNDEPPTVIEQVVDTTAKIYMINGRIICIGHGKFLQPSPIPVKLASAAELVFDNCKVFKVGLVQTDIAYGEAQVYAKADCYYEYGLLENKGTSLTWNIKLHVDYEPTTSIEEANLITYENIAYRKNK